MSDAACLTPLALMVLALLDEGEMHPYEMIRLMRQRHDDRLVTITNGTVYHTVSRLERNGLVREVGVDRDGNRPERTSYAVTDAGIAAAVAWLREELPSIDRPASFRVALSEAHNLELDDVIALLRRRRDALAARLAELDAGFGKAMERAVPLQYLVEVERDGVIDRADLAWNDDLIARLERGELEWGRGVAVPAGPAAGPLGHHDFHNRHTPNDQSMREAARA